MEVWAQTPDRVGMDAAPFVLLALGAAACPGPGIVATGSVARKRIFPRWMFVLPTIFEGILHPLHGRVNWATLVNRRGGDRHESLVEIHHRRNRRLLGRVPCWSANACG